MKKAIDVANYTQIPTQDQVRCLLQDGYSTAIVGCSYGTSATKQLEAFALGGMDVEAYAFVEFRPSWQGAIDRALAALTPAVTRLWLDCEEDPGGMSPDEVITRIAAAFAHVQGIRPDLALGVYTGGWWWVPNTGGNTGFRNYPLWTAEYTAGPPTLYGGWTKVAIWQYQGTVETCGLNTDRNEILEEEHMPTAEYDELFQRDEDIKKVLASIDTGVKFLIEVVNNLAPRIDALEKAGK